MFLNFIPKISLFIKYVEKYDRAGQPTGEKTAHALCMLGK
jgi:hypothetical protein